MNNPMLLIDADWLAFSSAIVFESENPFNPEGPPLYDAGMAWHTLQSRVDKLMGVFEAPNIQMHFSCSREDNFRRQITPSYKMNRKNAKTPVGLADLKEKCLHTYPCIEVPTLEADDTIALDATSLKHAGNCVICSVDKDFLSVPTSIWNPVKEILKKQSKINSFKFFIYQILTGDSADGFKGIPGVGKKGAMKFITEHSKNLYNIWEPMVALAEKKKVDEEYLVSQARLARLLQNDEYNYDTKEITLWEPSKIKLALQ